MHPPHHSRAEIFLQSLPRLCCWKMPDRVLEFSKCPLLLLHQFQWTQQHSSGCDMGMQVHQKEILLQHTKDLNTSLVCAQGQDLKLQVLMTLQDKSPLPYKQCDILQTGGEAQIPFQTPGLVFVWFGVGFLVGWFFFGGIDGQGGRRWFGGFGLVFWMGGIACLFFFLGLISRFWTVWV